MSRLNVNCWISVLMLSNSNCGTEYRDQGRVARASVQEPEDKLTDHTQREEVCGSPTSRSHSLLSAQAKLSKRTPSVRDRDKQVRNTPQLPFVSTGRLQFVVQYGFQNLPSRAGKCSKQTRNRRRVAVDAMAMNVAQ